MALLQFRGETVQDRKPLPTRISGSLVRELIKVLFPTPVIPMTPMKIGGLLKCFPILSVVVLQQMILELYGETSE